MENMSSTQLPLRKFLPLLERINSGDFQGFSTGGGPGFSSTPRAGSTFDERGLGLARELTGWMTKEIAELQEIKESSKTSKDFLNAIGKILFDTKVDNKKGSSSIVAKIAESIASLGGIRSAVQGIRVGGTTARTPAPARPSTYRAPNTRTNPRRNSGTPTPRTGGDASL